MDDLTIQRIMSRVVIDSGGCWIWQGSTSSGYGVTRIKRKLYYLHRLLYEHHKGPIGQQLSIDHLCRVKACCNPAHLEAVTQRENTLRGVSPVAENAQKTHCIRGHEFTLKNTRLKPGGGRDCKECQRLFQSTDDQRAKAFLRNQRRKNTALAAAEVQT